MITKSQQRELTELRHEVTILRSFIIGVAGKDPEGEYNPTFAQQVLRASQKKPVGRFQSTESFLATI
jgi:hypothetical protein